MARKRSGVNRQGNRSAEAKEKRFRKWVASGGRARALDKARALTRRLLPLATS